MTPKAKPRHILFGLVMVGVGVLAFTLLSVNSSPIPHRKLAVLKPGMSQTEVETHIGKPTDVFDDNREWAYSSRYGWPIVYVYFDDKHRLLRVRYDE